MQPIPNTDSLAHFKENSQEIIDQLKVSGQPLILTVGGEAELVVLARSSYQEMLAVVDRAEAIVDRKEAIEGIRRGLASLERGEGRPASEVFEDIRKRHGIPRQA